MHDKNYSWYICLILSIINFVLIYMIFKEKHLPAKTSDSQVTLTLEEQTIILEDQMEGSDFQSDLAAQYPDLFDKKKKFTLVHLFMGNTCRECINDELIKRDSMKNRLEQYQSTCNNILIFSGFNYFDFLMICRQYNIVSVSIFDSTSSIINQLGYNYIPSVLFLGRNKILFSSFHQPGHHDHTNHFYNRVFSVLDAETDVSMEK